VRCELAQTPPLAMLRPLAVQRARRQPDRQRRAHAGGEILVRTAAERRCLTLAVLDRGPASRPTAWST
jgi:hypothetical protein